MAYSDEYKSAQQVLAANNRNKEVNALNQEGIDAAEAAGVTHSEYIGYAAAFAAYEARPDVEPLAERRARENGLVADQNFRRKGTGSAAVFTSPYDGNVGGLVDEDGVAIDTPGTP